MSKRPLIVILPVFNEEAVIADVVGAWTAVLDSLGMEYSLRVRNDGSRDGTAAVLDGLTHPRLEVIHSENRGHGPTLLAEYRRAAREAEWVFQSDSDGEIPASAFPDFWAARAEADLIIGERSTRGGPLSRRLLTAATRIMVRTLFGPGLRDVNCPFRLMRAETFAPLFDRLRDDRFAPNVLISAHAVRRRLPIRRFPVLYTPRRTGEVSIRKLRLLRAALLSAAQTLEFRVSELRKSPDSRFRTSE